MTKTKASPMSWHDRYRQLVKYKEKYGDTVVPTTFKNRGLSQWTMQQRRLYKTNSLPQHMVEMLESIGFVWRVTAKHRNIKQEAWDQKYEELLEYKNIYGDTLVSLTSPSYKSLARWVSNQRTAYHKNMLSDKRKEKLEAIGFRWRLRG
ncbi:helicase associated domain-containing protein [Priestia filamentosa]|uniref:helicase associated domain-containing protein n=1 Tax=Priestia filamentosa TaxID=1402861 RepID=UPI003982D10A